MSFHYISHKCQSAQDGVKRPRIDIYPWDIIKPVQLKNDMNSIRRTQLHAIFLFIL